MTTTLASGKTSAAESAEPDTFPLHHPDANFRRFFAAARDGLVVAFLIKRAAAARPEHGRDPFAWLTAASLGTWLNISGEVVTVYTGKAEVGQNIRTSLSQTAAEELRIAPDSVRLVMGDTGLTPYDVGTFSSLTTPIVGTQLRRVAAAARELLVDLAARVWGVERGSISVADGALSHPATGRRLSFGRLAQGRDLIKFISHGDAVTPAERWTTAGTSVPKIDGPAHVTGRHKYTSDMTLPGMLYGKVLRPDSLNATLTFADTREAEAMDGVRVVCERDFVGVAAPDETQAARAVAAVKAEWETPRQPSRQEIFDYLKNHPAEIEGRGGAFKETAGSFEQSFAAADRTLTQTYTADYIAHAPLEPRAALARWAGDKLTVLTGTQRPFAVRDELARAFGIAEQSVRVIVPDTGSAYGGKHSGEAAVEAARLARAVGAPVKVVWTRREEFTHAYFRPAGVVELRSGVSDDGALTAWEFHNYNAGSNAILPPYRVANRHVEFHPSHTPLRQGAYRGLAATVNNFARETHMDELARMLDLDPLDFRLRNLCDERLKAVLSAAADAFGWGEARRRRSPGRGFGMAAGAEKGGYVAACVEARVGGDGGRVEVVRVVEAFECGAIINPRQLKSLVEGAIIQGLGGALFEAVEFENGRILNPSFSRYRVPRFSDVPSIEVVLLDRKDIPPAGAGESPIICIAPALGNAIFDATGIRRRSLPLSPGGLRE